MKSSYQRSSCSACRMDTYDLVETHFSDFGTDVCFLKSKPSSDDKTAFSGKHGEVLRRVIAETDLDPDRIMYTYALSCKGKKPKVSEFRSCNMRLMKELKQGDPKLIITLGGDALKALDRDLSLKGRRGKCLEILGWNVLPTIDPGELLITPDGYRDMVRDIRFASDVLAGRRSPVRLPPVQNYRFANTQDKFNKLMKFMSEKEPKLMAVDIETTGFDAINDEILSISLSIQRGVSFIIDWVNLINGIPKNFGFLDRLLDSTECIYHNGMFDDRFLRAKGMSPNFVHDTMLSSYALNELQGSHSLKKLASDYYQAPDYDKDVETVIRGRRLFCPIKTAPPFLLSDWADPVSQLKLAEYNGADSDYTFRLHEDLSQEMIEDSVDHLPKTLLIPAAKHFMQLKDDGMKIDTAYHDSLGKAWMDELGELESEMRKHEGAKYINLESNKQISELLFDTLKLKPMHGAIDQFIDQDSLLEEIAEIEDPEAQEYFHTASSAVFSKMKPRSTSMFMLYWLASQHDFPRLLVKHRLVSKKHNTYYEGIKKLIDGTGRIRPDYHIHGTRTGRLSSTKPNVHGTPRFKEIRRCYVADEGYTIIAPDYSQAEVRMLAHFADDDRLIQALHEQDIHYEISKELFGMTSEEMNACSPDDKKIKRRAAKTICFGLIYGRGPKSLATQMGVTQGEAEEFIQRFFLMMPKVRSWISRQEAAVMRDREVTSLYGRKRRFPFLPTKKSISRAKRQAVNMPIQSSVSDMTLLANIDILRLLKGRGIKALAGFHIHDGFLFQVPDEDLEESIEITKERMSNVGFETRVPFASDTEIGKTWGDLKSV
ncbi:hypothetical protein HN911_12545 [Candidatus Bathyarchaeota archaeon]|nr:hypothetical protein [Candidatus Bathyarchaeota archaeon]